jgi:UDP-glucose 4-epimerase
MLGQKLTTQYQRAIVTGGAGFIGSHLVEALLKDGLEVISIDDYSAGRDENLAHLQSHPKLRIVRADVTERSAIEPVFDGVDVVFHQAVSKNTVCMTNPMRDLEVNAKGTLTMLELAKRHGVKKFVHASTGSVYGEAQYYPTDEKHPVNPASYYGVSKLCGEKYVRLFSDLHDLDTTILRYYHVFGPRQDYSDVGGVVSIFGRRALQNQPLIIYGDGTQLRSFTSVYDIVGINRLAAVAENTRGEAFNCASGAKVTIQELAEAVLDFFGKKNTLAIHYDDWKPGDILKFDVDNTKVKNLGFDFQYSFEEGLNTTLNWVCDYFQKKAA